MQENIKAFANNLMPLIAILDIDDKHSIITAIEALLDGGIKAIEIPLRHKQSMECLAIAREQFPDIILCAGTVVSPMQIDALATLSLDFVISPGINSSLIEHCKKHQLNLLPGVVTPSDIMMGMEHNLEFFKFFPAQAMGGTAMLKTLYGPFKHCQFCASGDIHQDNLKAYLQLSNTFAVAGSWMATQEHIAKKNWQAITDNAKAACRLAGVT